VVDAQQRDVGLAIGADEARGYFRFRPGTLTVIFSASSTTCSLVRIAPSAVTISPEPVTSLRRSSNLTIAWMWTTEGVTASATVTMRRSRSPLGGATAQANPSSGQSSAKAARSCIERRA
jgi:hypothetical protein